MLGHPICGLSYLPTSITIRAVVRYRSYGNTYTFGSKFHTCVDERIGMYFGVNQKNLFWYLKKNSFTVMLLKQSWFTQILGKC